MKKICRFSIIIACILIGKYIVIRFKINDSFVAACLPALGIIIGNIISKIIDAAMKNRKL